MNDSSPPSVDKSGDRVQRMFGQIADRYDLMNHLLSGGIDIYWRKFTVRKAAPRDGSPILDICTGTGDLAIAYWKQGESKIPVTGTDFTPRMIELAKEKAARLEQPENAAPLTFLEADSLHLPFPENAFQIVSVAFGLRNINGTHAGIREMLRVCQPGGRVVVLEFSQPTVPILMKIYHWYFQYLLPRIGQMFAKNREDAYGYLPRSVMEFPSGEVLVTLMEECGLRRVRHYPLTFGIATLYVGEKEP